jgi:putative NADH-flavin reductase
MKIALFGATGTIGRRILREALGRGHTVTAIARDPSRVTERADGLTAVAGDIHDPVSVAATTAGHDAVVSAFGPSGGEGDGAVAKAARSLIAGLQAGPKRLVFVGGAGSLEAAPGVRVIDSPGFPPASKGIAQDHADALEVFRKEGAGLEWTYFSPPALIQPGERTGKFRLGGDRLVTDAQGQSRISAEDYAIALVDELEEPKHVRGRFTIGY